MIKFSVAVMDFVFSVIAVVIVVRCVSGYYSYLDPVTQTLVFCTGVFIFIISIVALTLTLSVK